jgi:hypothetical protein
MVDAIITNKAAVSLDQVTPLSTTEASRSGWFDNRFSLEHGAG